VALHERTRSGRGQHVDVSAQQAVALATPFDIIAEKVGEEGATRCAGGARMGPLVLRLAYPASDGQVSITHLFGSTIGPATARMMQCVCADGFCDAEMRDKDWIGFGELLATGQESFETYARARQCIADWTASKTKAQLLELAMERGLLIAPVSTPRDVAESPQLAARRYFRPLERPDAAQGARELGPFARFSACPRTVATPAPALGAHTREVLDNLEERALPPTPPGGPAPTEPPLAGLKILDFMWAIAGPMSTRMLADYGASVIRIESTTRLDVCRTLRPYVGGVVDTETATSFHTCNAGKRMLTLDLTRPEARDVVLDLVRWADVVCESFTPGTMKKLGFDYPTLREVKPDLIMLSTCLMGQTGPLATFAGYGNLAAAVVGFFDQAGWPDRDPAGPYGAYTDYIVPKFNAAAILAALEHRRRTGEGQHIDLSQAEAALHFLAPALLDWTVNGRRAMRAGNRDDRFAPHGCYPVAGRDAWIAIAIESDAGWQALTGEMARPDLASDARFASAAARVIHAETLDEILADWTSSQEGDTLQGRLQERGIAAHVVQGSAGCCADPQLEARGHFVEIREGGARTVVEATRSRLSRTPARIAPVIPTLGRDNQAVLAEVLGYDDERIAELVIAGLLD
ncbi:MAG: CoA transferase, partial [Myxococcota bacterium]